MMNNYQKLKITRKTSATSNNKNKEVIQQVDSAARILQLKAKIQKERQLMRKSGKRFGKKNEQPEIETIYKQSPQKPQIKNTISNFSKKNATISQIQIQTEHAIKKDKIEQKKTQQLKKQVMNLNELSTEYHDDQKLKSSKIFEKEFIQQKHQNKEMAIFLEQLGLTQFKEKLISLGYDQLQILAEIKIEDLNFIMMRAPQQRKLLKALENYKAEKGIKSQVSQETLVDKPAFFKTKTKMNVAIKQVNHHCEHNIRNVQTARPKSSITESTTPTNNSFLGNSLLFNNNPTFFCNIGGDQWSMDSLIRKGCSTCFKVFPLSQLKKQLQCYYCEPCILAENDPISLSLKDSMIRDYQG